MEEPQRPTRPVPKPGPHLAGPNRVPGVPPAIPARDVAGDRAEQDPPARLTALVSGAVQGVGFRWWTRSRALELGLIGTATNLPDGRVEVIAQGPREACERLLELLREQPPRDPPRWASRSWYRRPGFVSGVAHSWGDPGDGLAGFRER